MEDDVIDQFYTRYEDHAETSKGSDNNSAAAEPSQFRSLISRANKAGNDNNKRKDGGERFKNRIGGQSDSHRVEIMDKPTDALFLVKSGISYYASCYFLTCFSFY